MYCPKCGFDNDPKRRRCKECGCSLRSVRKNRSSDDRYDSGRDAGRSYPVYDSRRRDHSYPDAGAQKNAGHLYPGGQVPSEDSSSNAWNAYDSHSPFSDGRHAYDSRYAPPGGQDYNYDPQTPPSEHRKIKTPHVLFIALVWGIIIVAAISMLAIRFQENRNRHWQGGPDFSFPDIDDPERKDDRDDISFPNFTDPADTDPFVGIKTTFHDLRLGGIAKRDDMYIALQYVKQMDDLPADPGKEEVSPEHEVIAGFFEFYNGFDEPESVNVSEMICYVDGKQAAVAETFSKLGVDGIREFYRETLDGGCKLISCKSFEVPKGWKEIKFCFSKDCNWTITPEDVKKEDYTLRSVFDRDIVGDVTDVNDVIFSEDYELSFLGHAYVTQHVSRDRVYVVFKFRIQNYSGAALDPNSMGHYMRAYQNGFSLGEADFGLHEPFNGCMNLFDVKSVEPGMSCDVYAAFEAFGKSGSLYMVYDDGGLDGHYRGSVYLEN